MWFADTQLLCEVILDRIRGIEWFTFSHHSTMYALWLFHLCKYALFKIIFSFTKQDMLVPSQKAFEMAVPDKHCRV